MRQEPILFGLAALFAGYYAYDSNRVAAPNDRVRTKSKDYEELGVPGVDFVRPLEGREADFDRDLFSPPRDTAPLPTLALEAPPLEPLGALWPETAWGPVSHLHAQHLRVVEAASGSASANIFDPPEVADVTAVSVELDPDDPDMRAARIAGFKKQYDWLDTNQLYFGQIRNPDRFRLGERPLEKVVFFEVDPVTGEGKYPQPLEIERERVEDFGFADTPTNEIELGRTRFGDSLSPTEFERALRFAERCVELRNEAPRALEIAEEMFRMADAQNVQGDPRPRLGLARCYELGFRFEDAYATYEDLLANGHENEALVHARLGDLLARFRMDERAEERFARAVELDRSDWESRWLFGRFLMDRGRAEEALEQFTAAVESEPRGDEEFGWRTRIRADHAGALLAAGRPDDASDRFLRALMADLEDRAGRAQVAAAGLASSAFLIAANGGDDMGVSGLQATAGGAPPPDAGFEMLLAGGLTFMRQGDWSDSASALLLARRADPFRAYLASAALSFLAERVGQPELAYSFIEEALAAEPTSPWILYQRGRLLVQRGDLPGARESFRAALDRELDYVPALEELGDLLVELGEHEAAELYYERAVELEPSRGVTWSRRGFNLFRLDDAAGALECFDRARIERPGLASAALGQAWWSYVTGDSQEAETLFAQVVQDRRNEPENDAVRAYAERQGERIRDHETKEIWTEAFNRQPGRIANGWRSDEAAGPETRLRDGSVFLEGQHDRAGRTRVFRELTPDRFLSFFCDVTVNSVQGPVGLFVSQERTGSGGRHEVISEVVIGRNEDGKIQTFIRKGSNDEPQWTDLPAGPLWPDGVPVRVGIEKVEEGDVATFTLYVDGEPVATGVQADSLLRARQGFRFGVLAEAPPGRRVDLKIDDVEVIRRMQ